MATLKPNMYVRTEYGIFKIIRIIKDLGYNEREKRVLELDRNIPELDYNYKFYKDESIFKNAKFSSNLIDLIKAGDYVNELPVEDYYTRYDEEKDDYIKIGIVTLEDYWKGTFTSVEDIKSIVTKEQFDSMKYEVGE